MNTESLREPRNRGVLITKVVPVLAGLGCLGLAYGQHQWDSEDNREITAIMAKLQAGDLLVLTELENVNDLPEGIELVNPRNATTPSPINITDYGADGGIQVTLEGGERRELNPIADLEQKDISRSRKYLYGLASVALFGWVVFSSRKGRRRSGGGEEIVAPVARSRSNGSSAGQSGNNGNPTEPTVIIERSPIGDALVRYDDSVPAIEQLKVKAERDRASLQVYVDGVKDHRRETLVPAKEKHDKLQTELNELALRAKQIQKTLLPQAERDLKIALQNDVDNVSSLVRNSRFETLEELEKRLGIDLNGDNQIGNSSGHQQQHTASFNQFGGGIFDLPDAKPGADIPGDE